MTESLKPYGMYFEIPHKKELQFYGMGLFSRKNSIEEAVSQEDRFVVKVGHNRNNELIIKELKVAGDNLDEVIAMLSEALQELSLVRNAYA